METNLNKDSFNAWLESAKEKDDAYFEIIKKSQEELKQMLAVYPYKKAGAALFSFIYKLNFIKNGIVDLCESDNYYSANILYRSFLEHWLKANYIANRTLNEKTDTAGDDYLLFCNISEQIDYGKSVKKTNSLLGMDDDIGDIWEFLTSHFPQLKNLDPKSIQEKVMQFKHKNIIKYLLESKSPGSNWAHIIISEYSELSSYVHGGPQANEVISETDRYLKYKGMIKFVYNMCRFYTVHTYGIFAVYDKERVYPYILQLGQIEIVE